MRQTDSKHRKLQNYKKNYKEKYPMLLCFRNRAGHSPYMASGFVEAESLGPLTVSLLRVSVLLDAELLLPPGGQSVLLLG